MLWDIKLGRDQEYEDWLERKEQYMASIKKDKERENEFR